MGQVAKGTTASFALGPHGASVCGRTEHALPGVGVVGGVRTLVGTVFGGVAVDFVPADGVDVDEIGDFGALGTVFGLVGGCADGVCRAFRVVGGVFEGRIVPFAPVGGVFGGVALGLVSVDGVGVDEIGVFGALGVVFGGVALGLVSVGAVFGLVCGAFGGRIVPFAPVGAVFGLVCGAFDGGGGVCAFAFGVFGAAAGETGAKRSASDGAGGADVDEATEERAAERRLD